jgi:peptidylprolyl isomerase
MFCTDTLPTVGGHRHRRRGVRISRRSALQTAFGNVGAVCATTVASSVVAAVGAYPAQPAFALSLPGFLGKSSAGSFETKGAFGALPLTKQTDPSVGQGLVPFYDFSVGDGLSPEYGQVIRIQWAGYVRTAADAPLVKFDSSIDRNSVMLTKHGSGRLIQGLEAGIHTMKVGGKRRIVLPLRLAYTEKGIYGPIPPQADRRRALDSLLEEARKNEEASAKGGGGGGAEVVFDVHLLSAMTDDADPGYYKDDSLSPEILKEVQDHIEVLRNAKKPTSS